METYVSINRWTDQENVAHLYNIEFYSGFKKKEILYYAATWMNLDNNILSETTHSQKAKYCMIPLTSKYLK